MRQMNAGMADGGEKRATLILLQIQYMIHILVDKRLKTESIKDFWNMTATDASKVQTVILFLIVDKSGLPIHCRGISHRCPMT